MPYTPKRIANSHFHTIRGLNYHVREWGTPGQPLIILLHGWMDTAASFQFFVDHLAHDWHIVAPDWRGYGQTDYNPSGMYWFPDYLGDLDALFDIYTPDQPAFLIGHSMGGNIASLYAGSRPKRVKKLVNLEGPGLPPGKSSDAPGRYKDWLNDIHHTPRLRTYASFDALAQRLMKQNPRLSQDYADFNARHWGVEHNGEIVLRADPNHKRKSPLVYHVEDAMACWAAITAPVLWVYGKQTPFIQLYKAEDIEARKASYAQLQEVGLDDAGHMLHHDQPAALARAVEDFLM